MAEARNSGGDPGPRLSLLVPVFAVAMAVLGFEVCLTRAFSVLLRFHYVFLAISLATCGLGIGGLLDFGLRRGGLRGADPRVVLVWFGSACAVLMPLALVLLFATPLSAQLTSLWVVSAICLPPFLAAGAFLSHAFAWHARDSGRLYGADLTGASLGSFLVIAALQVLGGINGGIVWGVAVGIGVLIFCLGMRLWRLSALPGVVTLAVLALLVLNRSMGLIDLPVMPLANDPNAKPLFQELGDPTVGAKIVDTEWNAFARTDVVSNRGRDDLFVYTDGEVPTNMIPFDGDLRKTLPVLREFIGFYAFQELRPEKALLIGPGGGLDILLALAVGTRQIDGAELNPSIPRLVRKYGDFTGHIYDMEGVNIRVDEGRSFVSRSRERYDLIYMALTKTATTATSSMALVESYIHTVEAFQGMVEHLSDRGALAFVCQSPLILMRAVLTGVAALERLGVERREAMRHVCLLEVVPGPQQLGPYRYMLLLARQAFAADRAREMAKRCVASRTLQPVYFPGAYEPEPLRSLMSAGASDEEFVRQWNEMSAPGMRVDFSACDDDRPFVVDMSVGIPPQISSFLWWAGGLALALAAAIVLAMRGTGQPTLPGPFTLGGAALYFCCLGIGFMLVEVVLSQRLVLYLGYPVLTLSVILFSLLLGGGLGSLWSQSWRSGPGLALRAALAAVLVALLTQGLQAAYPHLVTATLAWDIRLRCAVTMALLIPLGFVMGTPFPSGVRVVGEWARDLVPWMWGLNGLTSVVGSVGAMALAKLWGFQAVLLVGSGVYMLAALLAGGHWLRCRGSAQTGQRAA